MKRTLIILPALLLALTACGGTSLTVRFDAPVSTDIAMLTKASDFVVTGQYVSFDKAWNLARDAQDASQESKTAYAEGHLYTFRIDSVLKGEIAEETITVNLLYGEQHDLANGDSVFVPDPHYTEPDTGADYMLFLSKDGHVSYQGYYGASTPWSVRISEEGAVELEIPSASAGENAVSTYQSDGGQVVEVEYEYSGEPVDFLAGMSEGELLQAVKEAAG